MTLLHHLNWLGGKQDAQVSPESNASDVKTSIASPPLYNVTTSRLPSVERLRYSATYAAPHTSAPAEQHAQMIRWTRPCALPVAHVAPNNFDGYFTHPHSIAPSNFDSRQHNEYVYAPPPQLVDQRVDRRGHPDFAEYGTHQEWSKQYSLHHDLHGQNDRKYMPVQSKIDEWGEAEAKTTIGSISLPVSENSFDSESNGYGNDDPELSKGYDDPYVEVAVDGHGRWDRPAKRWQVVGKHAVLVQRKAHLCTWEQIAVVLLPAPYQSQSTQFVTKMLNSREVTLDTVRRRDVYRWAYEIKRRNPRMALPPMPRPFEYLSEREFQMKIYVWVYLLTQIVAENSEYQGQYAFPAPTS
eukprot:GEMP01005969.1.p1 GENE.GEMP01005969.1~~GEMP01005969.1.p1  ORF type:complete len:354 (-),score=76.39 GEMP01005969.1:2746-3807(-)